jgi:predicted nucleic acid-binding protein
VLDTNVVFDWLVFNNSQVRPWADAIESGQLQWVASAAMRGELMHVLGRGVAAEWQPDRERIEAHWVRWAQLLAPVDLHGAALRLRCSDADDQKFIDLALGHGIAWLVTRDRALLKLARRARPWGVTVVRPQDAPHTHPDWPKPSAMTALGGGPPQAVEARSAAS